MADPLKQRKEQKARKPAFIAQDAHKKKRIRARWKRPRGLQSKVRLNKLGYNTGVSTGWRSPKAVRGTAPNGLEQIRVETRAQLEALDAKTQGAMVSGRVSMRTKKTLYDAAAKLGVTILNRDSAKFAERYETKLKLRAERKQRLAKKQKARTEQKKAAEKKDAKASKAESKPGSEDPEPTAKPEAKQAETKESKAEATQPAKQAAASESSAVQKESAPAAEKKADAPAKKEDEPKKQAESEKEGSQ